MKRPTARTTLWAVFAVHVAADVALLAWPWERMSDVPAAAIAWPMGQVSLVAFWAALGRRPSAVRFAGCLLGAAWAWLLLIVMLPDFAMRDPESAGWAVAFATQAAVAVVAIALGRSAWRPNRAGRKTGRPLQFGIKSLLLWTTAAALLLALGRTAVTQLGWSERAFEWGFFLFMPVFGAGNAAVALIVLVSLDGRRRLVARMAAAVIAVTLVGWLQPTLLEWVTQRTSGLSRVDAVTIDVAQAVYLYGTLLPLRLTAPTRDDGASSHEVVDSPPETAEARAEGCLPD